MIVGISMMTMAANSPPQLEVYIMESFNAYIPREIVRKFCLEANTSASIYSFQMLTKLNTEMQINPGCTNGSIMRANMRNSPHWFTDWEQYLGQKFDLAASVYDSRFFQLLRKRSKKTCEYEQAEREV